MAARSLGKARPGDVGDRGSASRRPERPHLADRYWNESRRPLVILVFLMPLVCAYEAGLFFLLPEHPGILSNLAHDALLRVFDVFGVTAGLSVPAIVLVVVLLTWHLLSRQRWQVDIATVGLMAVESALLVVPLLVIGQVIDRSLPATTLASGGVVEQQIGQLDFWGKLTVSLGAGIYEELVFRMLLIAVVHTLLVDVGKASHLVGSAVAIIVSAAVFTWYHPLANEVGALSPQRVTFFFLAGVYFGAIFVVRGFGIVVAVHALYDVVVSMTLLPQSA